MTAPTPQQVLDLELPENDADAKTVREYLVALARVLWTEGEGLSGKRPFGNSGWQGDFDKAFIEAGWVEGSLDPEGWVEDVNSAQVDALVRSAIDALAARPVEVEFPSFPMTPKMLRLNAVDRALTLDADRDADALVQSAATIAAYVADGTVPTEDDDESTPKIEIRRPDDEHVEIWVDGEEVASGNHDELGWAGMDALVKAATGVAAAFDVEVESVGPGAA